MNMLVKKTRPPNVDRRQPAPHIHLQLHPPSKILRRKPQPRSPTRILKHDKLRLQENIAKDVNPDPATRLDPTETGARPLLQRRVVDIAPRHDGVVAFDGERDVWESSIAGDGVPALLLVVDGAVDCRVISVDNGVWDQEERGACVGDCGDRFRRGGAAADGVAARGEAPEALGIVDGRVGDVAGIGAGIDVAEVVGSWGALLEIGSEEWSVEAGFCVGEKGLLLVRSDGVDAAEGEAEQSVALVLRELRADFLGEFNGLAGDGGVA